MPSRTRSIAGSFSVARRICKLTFGIDNASSNRQWLRLCTLPTFMRSMVLRRDRRAAELSSRISERKWKSWLVQMNKLPTVSSWKQVYLLRLLILCSQFDELGGGTSDRPSADPIRHLGETTPSLFPDCTLPLYRCYLTLPFLPMTSSLTPVDLPDLCIVPPLVFLPISATCLTHCGLSVTLYGLVCEGCSWQKSDLYHAFIMALVETGFLVINPETPHSHPN